jgi:hypothetical protein
MALQIGAQTVPKPAMDGEVRNITTTLGQLSRTSVRSLLLWQSFKTTLVRKRVSKQKQDSISHSAWTNRVSQPNADDRPQLRRTIKGIPTRQRYHFVTVFVDQFSGLSFTHLQKTSSGEETLDAKMAFEGFARSLNVGIQHSCRQWALL